MFSADSDLPASYEELLHLFADRALDHAIYTLDPQGNVSAWNHGAERLFGYKAEEIQGQSHERFYPPDQVSRKAPERELALADAHETYEIDGWRLHRDGGRMCAIVVMTALRDERQGLRGFAVVTRDVTEQRRAQQELQNQKRRLRSILETAVDAVIIVDEQGMIESFNPAGERIFGYKSEEVIGQNVSLLMPQPFAAEHTSHIQRYLRTGEAKIIGTGREVQARRKDGSLFPADLAVSTFHDGKHFFTGVLRDISPRKSLEAEVLQIAEAEQRRIGQELHDDAQQQLSALTMIARNAADSLAALCPEHPDLNPIQTKVERVVKGLRDANQTLRQIARGLVPLQVEAHGLRDALFDLANQIQGAGLVSCQCIVDEGAEVHDRVAATHLYRIAQEALNNSLKHGQAKQIELWLRSQDHAILLEIADNGVGISDAGKQGGRGLEIMAYRAGLIGAVLTVRQRESGGTLVSCRLPQAAVSNG